VSRRRVRGERIAAAANDDPARRVEHGRGAGSEKRGRRPRWIGEARGINKEVLQS